MADTLEVGISTCPNDTFAFCGLLNGAITVPGVELSFELMDVQALNEAMRAGRFDLVKASFAAALPCAADYYVMPTGAALGHGVGPVLLSRARGDGQELPPLSAARILVPGAGTTAAFLLRLFHPEATPADSVVFSEILPALQNAETDYGVCIHEGRFTYKALGLSLIEDLGESWRQRTGLPLPLGGIFGRNSIDVELLRAFGRALKESIDYARSHPVEAETMMSAQAQELDPPALWKHVELYVNENTRDLGRSGRHALQVFATEAQSDALLTAPGPFQFLD
ncbi:MAG: 1,4-dihydroxy-6-naphthoate synthase [Planctomycetota bacterium]